MPFCQGLEAMSTTIDHILAEHAGREGPLLPILHDVQDAFGYISEDTMRTVANALNLTRAEVYGVVSFYHDFKTKPDELPVIKLCKAEACQARGVRELEKAIEGDASGIVKLEAIYCLGLCTSGPAAMTGSKIHARLTPEKMTALIKEVCS